MILNISANLLADKGVLSPELAKWTSYDLKNFLSVNMNNYLPLTQLVQHGYPSRLAVVFRGSTWTSRCFGRLPQGESRSDHDCSHDPLMRPTLHSLFKRTGVRLVTSGLEAWIYCSRSLYNLMTEQTNEQCNS